MWEITHETNVDAAHQLRFAPGEGERLHGHSWRIRATLGATELDRRGFVVDFADLSRGLRETVEPYEHVFLNELEPFTDLNPTAENIARVVAENLAKRFDDGRVRVLRVDVWEGPYCQATYIR